MGILLVLLITLSIIATILLFQILKQLKSSNQHQQTLINGVDKIQADSARSMSRLEDYLSAIAEHFGKDAHDHRKQRNLDTRLYALLKEGSKGEAVKQYQDISGKGLKESEKYIDELERKIKNKSYSGDTLV
ncbi:MAG TPA: hypothetical protein VLX68_13455 [Chitinivibrionales bacterium]|nr:hypothetical protein [Chitinivibrionales bacterium]